jgi:hypothetical protein
MDLSKFVQMFRMQQDFFRVRGTNETLQERVEALESEVNSLLTILSKLCKEIETQTKENYQD